MTPANKNFVPILDQIKAYKIFKRNADMKKQFPDFWNVEKDGSECGYQADTLEQAQELADSAFADQCCEETTPRNGEEFEEDVVFIKYEYDADLADYKETERKEGRVFYEHYHGDYAEHNTYGR